MTPRIDSTNLVELPTNPPSAARFAVRHIRIAAHSLRSHPDLAAYAAEMEVCADQLVEDFSLSRTDRGTIA